MIALLPYPFDSSFMERALVAGLIVGVFAPMVGTYLVQKRMALIGDGIGHLVVILRVFLNICQTGIPQRLRLLFVTVVDSPEFCFIRRLQRHCGIDNRMFVSPKVLAEQVGVLLQTLLLGI